MTNTGAWLLKTANGLQIAVAEFQMTEYLLSAKRTDVPLAPDYCREGFVWRDDFLPLMNIDALAGGARPSGADQIAVLAYQTQPGAALQYLGLAIREAPRKIRVDDHQAGPLPEDCGELLHRLAVSCFQHDHHPTLVLELARLCSAEFRDCAAAHALQPQARGQSAF
jgi:chemotaxis signal transduction protein